MADERAWTKDERAALLARYQEKIRTACRVARRLGIMSLDVVVQGRTIERSIVAVVPRGCLVPLLGERESRAFDCMPSAAGEALCTDVATRFEAMRARLDARLQALGPNGRGTVVLVHICGLRTEPILMSWVEADETIESEPTVCNAPGGAA